MFVIAKESHKKNILHMTVVSMSYADEDADDVDDFN